jgi:hypothetical protein
MYIIFNYFLYKIIYDFIFFLLNKDMEDKDYNNIEDKSFNENLPEEYEALEEKNLLYKLKRWEKNLLKKLRKFFLNISLYKEHKEEINKQNIKLNEDIKKEMENLEIEKKEIIKEKEESIKKLEIEKKKLIDENDKKYNEILIYLESIKNDRNKLIEFLNRKNII